MVTGTGAVTALGPDTDTTWRALLAGRTAVRRWDDLADEGFPIQAACRIDDADWGSSGPPDPCRRGSELGRRAATEALGSAGLLSDGRLAGALDPARLGCFVGTTMGESAVFEEAARCGRFDLDEGGGHVFAESVAAAYGITGPRRTFGTACAAGNYAIAAAARAVATGRVDVALAGGVEPFSRIAMLGFARMRAMAPAGCAPFGRVRRGMTLGEGAAFLVLQRRRDVAAHPLARVGSVGLAADAHHPTAPREDGERMQAAMRMALRRTGVAAEDIGWVSAHGTGTPLSDAAEARSLVAVLGEGTTPVSSIKGAIGHTMGAATAIEAVAAVCALREDWLPPNTGTAEPDEALGIDVVTSARRAQRLDWVMSCGFAFGGLDSALLLGRTA